MISVQFTTGEAVLDRSFQVSGGLRWSSSNKVLETALNREQEDLESRLGTSEPDIILATARRIARKFRGREINLANHNPPGFVDERIY